MEGEIRHIRKKKAKVYKSVGSVVGYEQLKRRVAKELKSGEGNVLPCA